MNTNRRNPWASDEEDPVQPAWRQWFLQPWALLCHHLLFPELASSHHSPLQVRWAVRTGFKDSLHFWAWRSSSDPQDGIQKQTPPLSGPGSTVSLLHSSIAPSPNSIVKFHCLQKTLSIYLPAWVTSVIYAPTAWSLTEKVGHKAYQRIPCIVFFNIKSWISSSIEIPLIWIWLNLIYKLSETLTTISCLASSICQDPAIDYRGCGNGISDLGSF